MDRLILHLELIWWKKYGKMAEKILLRIWPWKCNMATVVMATVYFAVNLNLKICVFSYIHHLHGVKWLNSAIIAKLHANLCGIPLSAHSHSCDWLHKPHIALYRCCNCKLEYLWGYSDGTWRVLCSYCDLIYCACSAFQSTPICNSHSGTALHNSTAWGSYLWSSCHPPMTKEYNWQIINMSVVPFCHWQAACRFVLQAVDMTYTAR